MIPIVFFAWSAKNSATGEAHQYDGCAVVNLDEVWEEAKHFKVNKENMLIGNLIDTIGHEVLHIAFSEASGSDQFNDQDERIFELISDWVDLGIRKSLVDYD